MNSIERLKKEMIGLLPSLDSRRFDPAAYAASGVFVVRNAIAKTKAGRWRGEYLRQIDALGEEGRKKGFNPVEFLELKEGLDGIWRDPEIVEIAKQIFGANVGVFKRRFVVKDKNFRGDIFLHQDTGYQIGTTEKASFFIALSEAGPQNGGLAVYPGTRRFGFLGDAGEINRKVLPADWPTLCPKLEPGDMLIMHSMTWHESGNFTEGPDRILTDFIYQRADDPSTIEVVAGEGGWEPNFLTGFRGDDFQTALFQRSRTLTIKELYKKLEVAV